MLEQRGERRGTGAFGHGLLDLEVEADGLLDVRLAHGEHVVGERADDLACELPGFWNGDAVGDGVADTWLGISCECGDHRRTTLRLHSDELDIGRDLARHERDPGQQTATAHRSDDRFEIGVLGEHLDRDGALAGDHRRLVERVHEREAVTRRAPARARRTR